MGRVLARLEFDGCLALVFVIGAAVAFAQTYSFPATAAAWPRWVIGSFAALSALLVVLKLVAGRKPS
ncbi:hypothetical protein [Roseitranquillus sediminis]|uniref:hypothetical protein n=1 Tax=Roseitranquillus sediminis TaxID=2809051 RepID=UPI001D0CA2DC|nr:hypothetical protein [Roseitranquillus sediminis]MBM9593484.1 hypothetical protein [Roseitranquillus sediminis]